MITKGHGIAKLNKLCGMIGLERRLQQESLFELVYGLDVTLLVHLRLPAYQLLQSFTSKKDVVQHRIDQIVELDETRRRAFENCCKNQSNVKIFFDKSSRNRGFF